MKATLLHASSLAVLVAGCASGPDYERPSLGQPQTLGLTALSSGTDVHLTTDAPWARWWTVFQDAQLEGLVEEARKGNEDYHAAIARVHEARALAEEAFAPLLPSIGASGNYAYEKTSRNAVYPRTPSSSSATGAPGTPFQLWSGSADMSYELDLWGRLRRGLEAAQNDAASFEDDRKNVEITVVSDTVQTYFDLGSAEVELEITKNALAVRRGTLELVKVRYSSGIAKELELRQAEGEVASAAAQVPEAQHRRDVAEHRLAILIGRAPDVRFAGKPPASFEVPPEVPIGIPSALLERRPDIRAAERRLVAANARIGEAYADFFPRVTILGNFGYASLSAATVADFGGQLWSIGPSVRVPIFEGGRLVAAWHAAQARTDEATASYRQTVLNAFAEVADSISGLQNHSESRARQTKQVLAAHRAVELATADYKEGLTTYLNVLDAERTLLAARLSLLREQRAVLGELVQLQKALGGGWSELDRNK
jgi:NodT family efflux transporter outer membrane factor (OMF) lipoprotein